MGRREYEMDDADAERLGELSKPAPYIMLQCGPPPSAQEGANAFWRDLASRLGFRWRTARPVRGKDPRFFTAEPAAQGGDDG